MIKDQRNGWGDPYKCICTSEKKHGLHFWLVPCVLAGTEHTQGMCSGLALAHAPGWTIAMEQCATDQTS